MKNLFIKDKMVKFSLVIQYKKLKDLNVRSFSATRINRLSEEDKKKLRDASKTYAEANPVPVIKETADIRAEKAEDLAARFLDDKEGLKDRKGEVKEQFEELHEAIFGPYFTTKTDTAIKAVNREKKRDGKAEVSVEEAEDYLDRICRDPDKVTSQLVSEEYSHLKFFSKSALQTYRDSVKKHEIAEKYIDGNPLKCQQGNAHAIEKDRFKEELDVIYPSGITANSTSSEAIIDSTSSKRSLEETGESSHDSSNKRSKTGNSSSENITDQFEAKSMLSEQDTKSLFFLLDDDEILEAIILLVILPLIIYLFIYTV